MVLLAGIAGAALVLIVLWDAFETIVLPRRVRRRFRLTRLFYRSTWRPWAAVGRLFSPRHREDYLGFFGPLSLLVLLTVWAIGLVIGFGLLHWTLALAAGERPDVSSFTTNLYLSGSAFFTLGLGDVVPHSRAGRALTVVEAGMGFGFLAIVIGYLPVLYQSFSRREVSISLLDARAGSPPSAAELLRRHSYDHGMEELRELLRDWERWSAELLESHLSYPVLSYFRSQHDNQSWVAALTTILDASALVMALSPLPAAAAPPTAATSFSPSWAAGSDAPKSRQQTNQGFSAGELETRTEKLEAASRACQRQAELTFAMARHAVVDLAQIFRTAPRPMSHDRLPAAELARLRALLASAGVVLRAGPDSDGRLIELRALYEPYVQALADYLHLTLPPWIPAVRKSDNWQTSAWGRSSGPAAAEMKHEAHEEHF